MYSNFASTLESYLIPAQEGLFKPSKHSKKYQAKTLEEKFSIWLEYLKKRKFDVQTKLPANIKVREYFGNIGKKAEINGYEVILYTSKKDPEFKNPTTLQVSVLNKLSKKSHLWTCNILLEPEIAELMVISSIIRIQQQQFMQQQHELEEAGKLHKMMLSNL